jgi:predicted nucleic acid-binding protein
VLSELRRREPNANVVKWFSDRHSSVLYLGALTLGEFSKGLENVPGRERRLELLDWLEIELPAFFRGRILPIDSPVADRWGRLQAEAKRPVSVVNSLLAATALHHELRLITRNEKDFVYPGLEVINPWFAV